MHQCFGGETGQSCAVDVNGYVSLLITVEQSKVALVQVSGQRSLTALVNLL